jgi:hypothetical protein
MPLIIIGSRLTLPPLLVSAVVEWPPFFNYQAVQEHRQNFIHSLQGDCSLPAQALKLQYSRPSTTSNTRTWTCATRDSSLLEPLPVLLLLALQVLLPLQLLLPIGLPDELRLEPATFLSRVKTLSSFGIHLVNEWQQCAMHYLKEAGH